MAARLFLPLGLRILVGIGSVLAAFPAGLAFAEAIASGHAQWEGGAMIDPGAGGKSVPYAITGPGQLVVDYVVTPYREREFYASTESCLITGGTEYWEHVSSETWFGSQRSSDYASPPPANGTIADKRVRTIWKIPGGQYAGSFMMNRPVKCGLADCDGFAGTVNFTAVFYPEGQSPPPAAEVPQPGSADAGAGASAGGDGSAGAAAAPVPPVPPAATPGADDESRNLALGRLSTQSSVYRGTGVDQGPQHGNDGVTVGRDPHDLVHTDLEQNPWWYVDLGATAQIDAIRIYNRLNPEVLANPSLLVFVSLDGAAWDEVYRHDGSRWEVLTLPMTVQARFVLLQLAEAGHLQFYEVEVWGKP
ncbi:discoidin domain-containing protein [Rhodobacter sp. Har01]|uniref:galactose-binding domain-containing protein n=1 Tax=Rhodobacter sp. Har01 TaxID=2883999 RepID=UPI001D061F84|nr:discoidin domain-containing protein [Rhodobacter sp. Har01]MCB6179262.1 discoidin domain-containing protein [Rhodobacter sp. Har01]